MFARAGRATGHFYRSTSNWLVARNPLPNTVDSSIRRSLGQEHYGTSNTSHFNLALDEILPCLNQGDKMNGNFILTWNLRALAPLGSPVIDRVEYSNCG